MVKWTPALAVGIEEIDAQHQELFSRAARFVSSLERTDRQEIGVLLSYLRMYCVTHFGAEEAWMREVSYPGYQEHKAEHDRFVKDILAMSDEHERRRGPGLEALRVGTFLSKWLQDHLAHTDRAFASFLRAQSA
ncbi:MAG TPA: bacteriohemerythrin [Anaeromyxobacter sp.]|nr:bacteriohemerythrin [Anaeromyxobacter sp.]